MRVSRRAYFSRQNFRLLVSPIPGFILLVTHFLPIKRVSVSALYNRCQTNVVLRRVRQAPRACNSLYLRQRTERRRPFFTIFHAAPAAAVIEFMYQLAAGFCAVMLEPVGGR